eukprot:1340450-Prymnesium_polylepis.3
MVGYGTTSHMPRGRGRKVSLPRENKLRWYSGRPEERFGENGQVCHHVLGQSGDPTGMKPIAWYSGVSTRPLAGRWPL